MSSTVSAAALELRPRRSATLARGVRAAYAAAVLAAAFAAFLNPFWSPAVALVIAAAYRSPAARGWSGSITRLLWRADGTWLLTDRRGRDWNARLDPASTIDPRVLILRFRARGRRRAFTLVLCRDSERPEALRRLRRALRTRYRDDADPLTP